MLIKKPWLLKHALKTSFQFLEHFHPRWKENSDSTPFSGWCFWVAFESILNFFIVVRWQWLQFLLAFSVSHVSLIRGLPMAPDLKSPTGSVSPWWLPLGFHWSLWRNEGCSHVYNQRQNDVPTYPLAVFRTAACTRNSHWEFLPRFCVRVCGCVGVWQGGE